MSKRVLIFDNYDSFTTNLHNLLKSTRSNYDYYILRNKDTQLLQIDFDVCVISPGPMTPSDTGLLKTLFDTTILPDNIPTFGVCLGMQFMAYYYGNKITHSKYPVHGEVVDVIHNQYDIFNNVNTPLKAARYNSLEIEASIHNDFEILANEENTNSIMAIKHKSKNMVGVQFHPESFLTNCGDKLIDNFFKLYVEN